MLTKQSSNIIQQKESPPTAMIKNEYNSETHDQHNIPIKQETPANLLQHAQNRPFENTINCSKNLMFNANQNLYSPYPINILPFQPYNTPQLGMLDLAQAYYKQAMVRQQQQYMGFIGINYNIF